MTVQIPTDRTDVCILGAGLAGLSLARQLHQRKPDLSITLVEHRQYPVIEAAHKVGESTVEIASHYFAQTLGLRDHMRQQQLPKFGLRLFFRGAEAITDDVARYDEVGPSTVLPIPTFQIDRGRFENHLAIECRAQGSRLLDQTTIRNIELSAGEHRVTVRSDDGEQIIQSRYLVDASGRRAWLRNQGGLEKELNHNNHAVWFRVEGGLDVDSWSHNSEWLARCHGAPRRLSTNHFTGPGYWVWLIPLASGTTSIGVVFDPALLALDTVNTHGRFMHWLADEHPIIASAVGSRAVLDFHVLKNYAVGSRQMMSSDGWMMTGDAGPFSDPFYSPGSDFIAFANGFITELIVTEAPSERFAEFQRHFMGFFTNTLSIYRGLYPCMGHRDLMVIKTLWDFSYYWAVLSRLFFTGRYTDPQFMASAQPPLLRAAALNSRLQRQLKGAAGNGLRVGGESGFHDYHAIPLFHRMKNVLLRGDSEHVRGELDNDVDTLERMATELSRWVVRIQAGERVPPLSALADHPAFA